jgi:MraZ protein
MSEPRPPEITPTKAETKIDHPGEPPLAPAPGPVVTWRLPRAGETFRTLAKKTLGTQERWTDIHKLNPIFKADDIFAVGTVIRLPADACIQEEEAMRPLPTLRARPTTRPRVVLPLTGTFPVTLDDQKGLILPRSVVQQLSNCDTVLVSPGSDKCLWLTNQAHLDRLAAKLDKSPARESDVRTFKRLYYAQIAKVPMKEGRIVLSEKLVQFAGLHQEVVLVGIDDHFEVWDAARWRRYTQAKKAAADDY